MVSFNVLDLNDKESLNRVGWFFRHESDKIDKIAPPALLSDDDRWRQCTEAIIAEDDGNIIGIVTLAPNGIDNSNRPTIDTLYVPKMHREKGLGYSLFEQGLKRLIRCVKGRKVFCQLQSSKMLSIIARLPKDLESHLETLNNIHVEDLAEKFEELDKHLPE